MSRSAALVLCALLASGCADSSGVRSAQEVDGSAPIPDASAPDDDGRPDSPRDTTTANAADRDPPSSEGPDVGQSYEEAEATGVLTGEFDMLLVGPSGAHKNAAGCLEVTVAAKNVGRSVDSYRFEADTGEVEPSALSLAPDESADLLIEICDPSTESLTLNAYSDGRDGELVDQMLFS